MNPVIHIVDDDRSLLAAMERLLRAAGHTVRTYGSAGEFLLEPPDDAPGCLLLDVRMPGPSGLDLQASLDRLGIRLPVVFLSGHADLPIGVRAMKAGAVDFLTKPVDRETLLDAIARALAVDGQRRAESGAAAALRSRLAQLSAREREVFERVTAGKLNKQIAAELGTTERTIKAHRANIMEKMQVASLAELVHIAAELRLR